jgi:hypothetical protein
MNQSEMEKVTECTKDVEFWEKFLELHYAQPAAFISSITVDGSRSIRTVNKINANIKRFCDIFKGANIDFIDRHTILSSLKLVGEIDTLK